MSDERKEKNRRAREQIACLECGRRFSASNFAKHIRSAPVVRRASSASATMCRRTAFGSGEIMSARDGRDEESDARSMINGESDVECESSIGSVTTIEARFAGLSLAAYTLANAAARSTIAESHDEYDVVKLLTLDVLHQWETNRKAIVDTPNMTSERLSRDLFRRK